MLRLDDVPTDILLTELRHRVNRLHQAAHQPSSVAGVVEALEQHAKAWRLQGSAEQLQATEDILTDILDKATAGFEQVGDKALFAVDAWRNGRRHLWQLVEQARNDAFRRSKDMSEQARLARANVDVRLQMALAPAKRMSVRLGEALLGWINAWEAR